MSKTVKILSHEGYYDFGTYDLDDSRFENLKTQQENQEAEESTSLTKIILDHGQSKKPYRVSYCIVLSEDVAIGVYKVQHRFTGADASGVDQRPCNLIWNNMIKYMVCSIKSNEGDEYEEKLTIYEGAYRLFKEEYVLWDINQTLMSENFVKDTIWRLEVFEQSGMDPDTGSDNKIATYDGKVTQEATHTSDHYQVRLVPHA